MSFRGNMRTLAVVLDSAMALPLGDGLRREAAEAQGNAGCAIAAASG